MTVRRAIGKNQESEEQSRKQNEDRQNREHKEDAPIRSDTKTSFKVTIKLTGNAAEKYKDKIDLAIEINRNIKVGSRSYRAYIKDSLLHITCKDPELHQEFKTGWNQNAFNYGIMDIQEPIKQPELEEQNKIYAFIGWEMNEREINLLCDTYQIKKETIKQIKGNKFLLELRNKEAFEKISKMETIQLGTEPIRISIPGKRMGRIIQCFTCQQYGHFSKFCPTKIFICRLCARTHDPEKCPEYLTPRNWRCINCKNEINSNHKAGSYQCPVHQAEMQKSNNRMTENSFQNSTPTTRKTISMQELKVIMDEYTDKYTSFAKCMYYDSTITLKNIDEVGKAIFNKELRQVKEIVDPVDNDDEDNREDENNGKME